MIFLLFIIPATSANDNTTDIIEIDNGDSISDDNLLNENVGNTENILSDASPHKELTDDDLKNDSIIYLENGEYDYKQEYKHRNITFIGEDTSKTIINGNESTIHITEFLSFSNLTLKNIKIQAPENLTATNVIFKDFRYNESERYQTALIYNDAESNINLVNCTFSNIAILDKGIMELDSGTLNMKDSIIINNENVLLDTYSSNGIISTYASILNIDNCEFIYNKIGGIGGVLSCESSTITVTNSTFVNTTSRSSPCLRASSSNVVIDLCKFINNSGTTNFGSVNINKGTFYISNCEFINNSAKTSGGSIYHSSSSLSDITIENCTFYDSKAKLEDPFIPVVETLKSTVVNFIIPKPKPAVQYHLKIEFGVKTHFL